MPQTTLYDRTGKSVGSVELADALFAAPVNAAVLHQVVTAQLAGRRLGHARHEDPRRGPRRRREAVPPEGHRPRPPGLAHRAALHGRRRRVRAAPALLRAAAAAQDEAPRAARRADREARRRGDQGDRHVRPRRRAKTKDLVGVLGALEADAAASSWSRPAATRSSSCSARNLPTVEVILADSLNVVDLLNADVGRSSSSRRSRGWRRCTRERPDRRRDHPPPGHQREVDRRVRPRQVHLRGPRRREQDPDQGGGRGAVREGEGDRRRRQRADDARPRRSGAARSAAGSPATPRPGARRS